MSMDKNPKCRKIYWKQIIIIIGLIISFSCTMLHAVILTEDINFKNEPAKESSPKIILITKDEQKLILQKLNQGNGIISNTDETNGRICFRTSGKTDNDVCFLVDENKMSTLEWVDVEDENKFVFDIQPAIRIDPLSGELEYRDGGDSENNEWHSFNDFINAAISSSLGAKDQELSENRTISLNSNSLTFDGEQDVVIDSNGNITSTSHGIFNDITVNSSLKINRDNNYIGIDIPDDISADYTFILPKNMGEANQALSSNGDGVAFWQSAIIDTNLGSNDQSLIEARIIEMNGNDLIFDGAEDVIIDESGNINIKGSTEINGTFNIQGISTLKNTLHVNGDVNIESSFIELGSDENDVVAIKSPLYLKSDKNPNHAINFRVSPDITANYTLVLPEKFGEPFQVLQTDGNGRLSWGSITSDTNLGENNQTLSQIRTIDMNGKNLIFKGKTESIIIDGNGNITIGGDAIIEDTLLITGEANFKNTLLVKKAVILNNNLDVLGNTNIEGTLKVLGPANLKETLNVDNDVTVNGSTTLGDDNNDVATIKGSLKLGHNTDYINIKIPSSGVQDYTLTLPENNGEASQVLVTNGQGITSWGFGALDTSISNNQQSLEGMRIVDMNGQSLIFAGIKHIVIDGNGNINIEGNAKISDSLSVTEHVNLGDTLNVAGNITISGSTTLGDNNDITTINGSLKLAKDNSGEVTIKAPTDMAKDYTFFLPQNSGSKGQVLTSDGSGITFWADMNVNSSLGASDQTLTDTRLINMLGNNLVFEGIKNIVITPDGDINIGGNANIGESLEVEDAVILKDQLNVTGAALLQNNLDVLSHSSMERTFEVKNMVTLENTLEVNNNVTIGGSTTLGDDDDITSISGALKLTDINNNNIAIKASANMARDYTLILPQKLGFLGQVLVNEGNGITSWQSVITDTNLGNNDQTLAQARTVEMNGNNLIFDGAKNVIIDADASIDIGGDTYVSGTLEVMGAASLESYLQVTGAVSLNNDLNVSEDTIIEGTLKAINPAIFNNTLNVDGNLTVNGLSQLGDNNTTTINGSLKLSDTNNNYITIKPPFFLKDYTFILPEESGLSDQMLVTDGTGKTSWKILPFDTYLGSSDQILTEARTVNMNRNSLTFAGGKNVVITANGDINIGKNAMVGSTLQVLDITTLQDMLTVDGVAKVNNDLNVLGNTVKIEGVLEVKEAANLKNMLYVNNDVTVKGSAILGTNNDATIINNFLEISNNNGNAIIIKAPDTSTSYNFFLPNQIGTLNQVLTSDGTGKTFWESAVDDINLGNSNQTLTQMRIVDMNRNSLTFNGAKDIVIQSTGDIDIASNASVGGTLEVAQETILKDTLTVDGTTTLNNELDVTGAATIGGTLQVIGTVDLYNTLNINDNININGETILGVDNNTTTTINGPLKISDHSGKYITIESPSYIRDYTFVFPGTIGTSGQTLVTDGTGKTFWKSITGDTNLGNKNQTLLEDRTVNMNRNNLIFEGTPENIIIDDNGDVNIGGSGIIGGDFQVTGMVTLADTLTVSGTTTLNNALHVSGETNFKGSLQVSGVTTLEDTLYVIDNTIISGSTILGDNNSDVVTINGSLKILDNNKHIIIKAPESITDDYTIIFPTTRGTLGQILIADGTGKTFWKDTAGDTSLATNNQTLSANRIVNMDGNNLIFEGTSENIIIYDNGDININENANLLGSIVQVAGSTILNDEITAEQAVSLNATLDVKGNINTIGGNFYVTEVATIDNNISVLDNVTINGSTTFGNDNTDITTINGIIKLADNDVNYITIKAPDALISYTLTLPEKDGDSSYVLTSNGTGQTSWEKVDDDTYLGITDQNLTEMRTVNMSGKSLTFNGAQDVVIDDNSNININGNGTVEGNFEVIKSAILDDKLTVAEVVSFKDQLNVTGNTILGNLNVAQAVALENNLDVLGDVTINGSTTLGNDNTDITTINGSIQFSDNDVNYITIKTPDSIATSYLLILPITPGAENQILTTNGNGVTSWASAATDTSIGTHDQNLSENRIITMDGNNIEIQGSTKKIIIYDNGGIEIEENAVIEGDFQVAGAVTLNNTLTVDGASILNNNLNVSGEANLKGTLQVIGAGTLTNTLDVTDDVTINGSTILGDDNSDETIIKGSFKLENNDANKYVKIKPPASVTGYTLTLPINDGDQDDVLAADGMGGTFWAPPIIDKYLGNEDQVLNETRRVIMNGHKLTFQSIAGDIILYDNGDINVDGKGTITGSFEVTGPTVLNNTLTVEKEVNLQDTLTVKNKSTMENNLQVKEATTLENTLTVGDNVIINGSNIILGNDNNDATTIKGTLNLGDDTSNYITFKAPDSIANDYTLILPLPGNINEAGKVLAIDAAGQTYWTFAGGDTNISTQEQVLSEDRIVNMNGNNLTFQGPTGNIEIDDNGDVNIGGSGIIGGDFQVTGMVTLADTLTVGGTTTLDNDLHVSGETNFKGSLQVAGATTLENTLDVTDSMTINGLTTLGDTISDIITINGSLKLFDSDASNYIEIKAPDSVTSDYTFVLPLMLGQNDEVLRTDGNGVTFWDASTDDTSLSTIDQTLTGLRQVTMNGHTLTFVNATKDIVIDENGNITIRNLNWTGDLQATGPTILQGSSNTIHGPTEFKGNLDVEEEWKSNGTVDINSETTFSNKLTVKDFFVVKGSTTIGIGDNSVVQVIGDFKLIDENSVSLQIKASNNDVTPYTFVFPEKGGTDDLDYLHTDGSGATTWKKWYDIGIGNTDFALEDNRIIGMNHKNLIFQGTTKNIVIHESGDINLQIDGKATIGGTLEVPGATAFNNALTVEKEVLINNTFNVKSDFEVDGNFEVQENGTIEQGVFKIFKKIDETFETSTSQILMKNGAIMKFHAENGNVVQIKLPLEVTSDFTLSLPEREGNLGEILVTDNNKQLLWKDPDYSTAKAYQSGYHKNDCDLWNTTTGDDTIYILIDKFNLVSSTKKFGFCLDKLPRSNNATNWVEANEFCLSRGMRLPTYPEWRVGCDRLTYGTVGNANWPITADHWEWASPYITLVGKGGTQEKLGAPIAGVSSCNSIDIAWINETQASDGRGIFFRCAR